MEWISVSDNLPKNDECVDVYFNDFQDLSGRIENVFYSESEKWWMWDVQSDRVNEKIFLSGSCVTHWMPLPEPPK